jgi:SAM-dependent methyltransferase
MPQSTIVTPGSASSGPGGSTCLACGTSLEGARALETPDRKEIAEGTFRILVCPGCGGGNTEPRVPADELGPYYESEEYGPHVSGGAMGPLFGFAMSTRLRTARLFKSLRKAEPGLLLDVGCGRGDLGAALIRRGWEVAGLDASERAVEEASARGVDAELGTLEAANLPDDHYDAIVFHHALEHVVDPVASLETARRALKPGGRLLIGVPNFASHRSHRYGERWWLLELPRHRFHFTPDALGIALDRAGFETESLRTHAAVLGTIASLQQRSVGHFLEAGPAFLAGYGLTLAAFPFTWASNEVRGGGELLNAVATPRAPG